MTADERKEARAHRNRIVAQNSHDKHKAQFSALQTRIGELVVHEADIIQGPQVARTVDSLEVFTNVDGNGGSRIRKGLLKWEGNVRGEHDDMWVDRLTRLLWRYITDITEAIAAAVAGGANVGLANPEQRLRHSHGAMRSVMRQRSRKQWRQRHSNHDDRSTFGFLQTH
ncbi:hypothetical protein EDB86DRAFT_1059652 [Lactarius hatsudake]|nr:hypothetical protein EDB86DRAFT_1059652 [Lactarius hatsudake]